MIISGGACLYVAAAIFCLGFYAVLTRRNAVSLLMGIELMLNAVNIAFVVIGKTNGMPYHGQIYALFIIVLAAAEASVGLAIFLVMYMSTQSINVDEANRLSD